MNTGYYNRLVIASAIIITVVCGCRCDGATDHSARKRPLAAQVAITAVREGLDAGNDAETTVAAVSKQLSRWYDIGDSQKEALEIFCREAAPLLYEWRQTENGFVSSYNEMMERLFDIDGYSYSLKPGKKLEFRMELSILNAKLYGREPFSCMPLPSGEEGVLRERDRYVNRMKELSHRLSIFFGNCDHDSNQAVIMKIIKEDVNRIDQLSSWIRLLRDT